MENAQLPYVNDWIVEYATFSQVTISLFSKTLEIIHN